MVSGVSEHLVFLLHAPFAAMGGVAVGERRAGFDRPGKSAIIGLIAAALGLDRSDEAAHAALEEGYGLGLGEIKSGSLMMDYHTTQTPSRQRNRPLPTRRSELKVEDLNTLLSLREYRIEPAYLVVLWARATPQWSIGRLGDALRQPHFVLYFGRKACPLGLPLDPRVIEAENARVAIDAYLNARTSEQADFLRNLRLEDRPTVLALDLDGAGDGSNALRVEHRRDRLESRRRWQFGLRPELLVQGGTDE
jgi:CRISPR system Cascade subunit CasD